MKICAHGAQAEYGAQVEYGAQAGGKMVPMKNGARWKEYGAQAGRI